MATKEHLLNYILLIFFSYWCTSQAILKGDRYTLKPGDTLDSSSKLLSANGRFSLRFEKYKTYWEHSYLVITEKSYPSIFIWLAPRDKTIFNDSAILTLDSNGTMKIMCGDGDPIVIYSSDDQPIKNTKATLSDTGSFVLQEVNPDGSTKRQLWQSFDHPTDILLPKMKLGFNSTSGQSISLTSWFSVGIPAPGPFTLVWDPEERQLIIRRRGIAYWKSGVLRDKRFEHISPSETKSMYDFMEEEGFFSYTNINTSQLSEWLLSHTGQLSDTKGITIAQADICYGYNTEGGCQKWKQPKCRGHRDTFISKSGIPFNVDVSTTTSDTSLSISDCRGKCWNDCQCMAYASLSENGTGCRFWTAQLQFLDQPSAQPPIFVLSSNPSHRGKKKWIQKTIIAVVALLVTIFCILFYLRRRRRRKRVLKGKNETSIENELHYKETSSIDVDEFENNRKKGHELRVLSYACVVAATNNFSLENKLGEGGFGPVYKGKLLKGQQIAVKRLSRSSGQGILEFKNELMLISELQHTNLVQLLGCCIHAEERILIYEYMLNKSLDFFLFDSNKSKLLDWMKRFNIIEGITQGLLYLHKYSRLRVIHRDLKASNILLDENMNPKISDFGMARIFKQNENEANTNRVVGTYGYMSPEYAMEGVFSTKSDIYSFGVLMLEIVSGRKNNSFYYADRSLNLVGYAWELWQEGKGLELMDLGICDSIIKHQMLRCIQVGLLCVEESVADRPTISDVLYMLTNENAPLPLPKKPAFSIGRKAIERNLPEEEFIIYSVNGLSISLMPPR